jgi:hypothetical protein
MRYRIVRIKDGLNPFYFEVERRFLCFWFRWSKIVGSDGGGVRVPFTFGSVKEAEEAMMKHEASRAAPDRRVVGTYLY